MDLRRSDLALALAIAFFQVAGTLAAATNQSGQRAADVLSVVLLLVGPVALLLRRGHPEVPLAISLAALITYLSLDYALGPIFLAFVIALVSCLLTRRRLAALVGAAALELSVLIALAADEIDLGKAAGATAWLLVVLAVSEVVRSRLDAAAASRLAFEQDQQRRAGDARLSMARELHDVLAHSISLISVQAGVGLHLFDSQPQQAREALIAIKAASADGLRDLRRTLDVLREHAALDPTPNLADLDRLIEGSRSAGLTVSHHVQGTPRPLDAAAGLAAYRVVQEALTNVSRHAGDKRVSVTVTWTESALEVRVDDDGPTVGPAGAGHGLAGMSERVVALGGQVSAGPRGGGGFSVHATLPLECRRREDVR